MSFFVSRPGREFGLLSVAAPTLDVVSPEREELLRLVENLADQDVSAVLADVRRHLEPAPEPSSTWPPPWFGSIRSGRTDTASRVDEILAEGFGRS